MKKLNQQGFSPFEITLLVLVVAALGFAGYTVWQKNKPDNQATTPVVTQKKEPVAPKLNDYKNDELDFSLQYPSEWGIASIADGPLSKVQNGEYKQLSFSQATNVRINFVIGPTSSPLDGCGYDDPVQNAQHAHNANQASLIGWEANSIKLYITGQGYNGPTVFKRSKTADDTGPGYNEISKSSKVLVYKDFNESPVKAGSDNVCSPVTQAQADEANAYMQFFHYAVNYSNDKVVGVNGQFDARKADDKTIRDQLTETLNTIK